MVYGEVKAVAIKLGLSLKPQGKGKAKTGEVKVKSEVRRMKDSGQKKAMPAMGVRAAQNQESE